MRTTMHPMLALFLRLTAVVAIAIVVLVVAGFLLKIAVIAAVIAAVVIGAYFLYTWIWRKPRLPIIR